MNTSMSSSDTRGAPSPDDLYQVGNILKVSYRVVVPTMEPFLPVTNRQPFSSYAIYYGRGRVIHAWSNTRTDYRVRVDTLRSLEATGLVVSNATQDMDAYCALVLGVHPLPQEEILPRARKALHVKAHSHKSSILLVLSARYGSIVIKMAKSFCLMLPHIVRGCDAVDMLAENLGDAVLALLAQQPPPDELDDHAAAAPVASPDQNTASVWLEYSCKLAAQEVRGIKSLLSSDISRVLVMWIMLTFDRATQSPTDEQMTYGMILSRASGPTASLVFNRTVQSFVVVFDADKKLLERLVRDRMECGICFGSFAKLRVKVFDCSHYTCGGCFKKLNPRVCPFCRGSIVAVREITAYLKQQAYDMMRAEECKNHEENDFDAPRFARGEDPAAPGYDGDEDEGEDEQEPPAPAPAPAPAPPAAAAPENNFREAEAMLVEDFDALAL